MLGLRGHVAISGDVDWELCLFCVVLRGAGKVKERKRRIKKREIDGWIGKE